MTLIRNVLQPFSTNCLRTSPTAPLTRLSGLIATTAKHNGSSNSCNRLTTTASSGLLRNERISASNSTDNGSPRNRNDSTNRCTDASNGCLATSTLLGRTSSWAFNRAKQKFETNGIANPITNHPANFFAAFTPELPTGKSSNCTLCITSPLRTRVIDS